MVSIWRNYRQFNKPQRYVRRQAVWLNCDDKIINLSYTGWSIFSRRFAMRRIWFGSRIDNDRLNVLEVCDCRVWLEPRAAYTMALWTKINAELLIMLACLRRRWCRIYRSKHLWTRWVLASLQACRCICLSLFWRLAWFVRRCIFCIRLIAMMTRRKMIKISWLFMGSLRKISLNIL